MKKYILLLIVPFLVSCGGGWSDVDRQYFYFDCAENNTNTKLCECLLKAAESLTYSYAEWDTFYWNEKEQVKNCYKQYGKIRKLPPLPDENNQPQESQMLKNNILVIEIGANKDVVLIETGAQESGQGFPLEITKLKTFIKDFVDNNGRDLNLSEKPEKAVIYIKSAAKAHWETFIATQDTISAAYKEMRNVASINKFGKEYDDLNELENKEIKKIYPLKLTETVKEN